jgi:hypothetical protein
MASIVVVFEAIQNTCSRVLSYACAAHSHFKYDKTLLRVF